MKSVSISVHQWFAPHFWFTAGQGSPVGRWLRWGLLALLLAHPSPAAEPILLEKDDFGDNIRRVFADDQMADIRVTFGYEDSKEFDDPWDPLRAENLTTYLVLNGFKPVPITAKLAEELGVPAAAPNLRVLKGSGIPGQSLRVAMIWSAATSKTAHNIGGGSNQQMRRSAEALQFLQKAATDAEVQIYLGHSRGGGGPDTFPPMIRHKLGFQRQKVDYSYYTASQPGLSSLRRCFKVSREKPIIIAWTSCASQRHFHDWFSGQLAGKRHPTSLLLSTRLAYRDPLQKLIEGRDEGLMVTVRLLEALRHHHSGSEFGQKLPACEMEARRKADKPLWKLFTIPPSAQSTPE